MLHLQKLEQTNQKNLVKMQETTRQLNAMSTKSDILNLYENTFATTIFSRFTKLSHLLLLNKDSYRFQVLFNLFRRCWITNFGQKSAFMFFGHKLLIFSLMQMRRVGVNNIVVQTNFGQTLEFRVNFWSKHRILHWFVRNIQFWRVKFANIFAKFTFMSKVGHHIWNQLFSSIYDFQSWLTLQNDLSFKRNTMTRFLGSNLS